MRQLSALVTVMLLAALPSSLPANLVDNFDNANGFFSTSSGNGTAPPSATVNGGLATLQTEGVGGSRQTVDWRFGGVSNLSAEDFPTLEFTVDSLLANTDGFKISLLISDDTTAATEVPFFFGNLFISPGKFTIDAEEEAFFSGFDVASAEYALRLEIVSNDEGSSGAGLVLTNITAISAVPEPSSLISFAVALIGFAKRRRSSNVCQAV